MLVKVACKVGQGLEKVLQNLGRCSNSASNIRVADSSIASEYLIASRSVFVKREVGRGLSLDRVTGYISPYVRTMYPAHRAKWPNNTYDAV